MINSESTMTPNQACSEVMKTVNASKLNFQVTQTPYSMYITIRKIFLKNQEHPKLQLNSETKVKDLEKENEYLKNEYNKLYTLYKTSFNNTIQVESDSVGLKKEIDILKREKQKSKEKLDITNAEKKQFNADIQDLKKHKNVLNSELKACRKEIAEQLKKAVKEKKNIEEKMIGLKQFKDHKLSEERDMRIQQKKVLKKEKKKENQDIVTQKNETVEDVSAKDFVSNVETSNVFELLDPLISNDVATSSLISYSSSEANSLSATSNVVPLITMPSQTSSTNSNRFTAEDLQEAMDKCMEKIDRRMNCFIDSVKL